MVNPAFWRDKRVFITGHTGFKGGWATLWLSSMGAHVAGFALPPDTAPDFFSLARLKDSIEHKVGDVRDRVAVSTAIRGFAPDVVLHMAAQSLVRRSYAQPVETYETNVMGTVHVLQALRDVPSVKAAIMVTSDKCYANDEAGRAFREEDPLGGHDPYSSSKGAAELVVAAYARSFFQQGCRIASARAGNVIGGGDWSQDRLVPDIVRGLMDAGKVRIRHPRAIRPWQHVLDPLAGYLLLAERMAGGDGIAGGWNFGPHTQDSTSVADLAQKLCAHWSWPDALAVSEEPALEKEALTLRLDSSKARALLGWRPKWDIETTLARTADWYNAFWNKADMRAFTLSQIEDYEHA